MIFDSKERRLAPALFVISLLAFPAAAQDLPDKIRGDKVYRDKVSVNAVAKHSDATVHVGDPELVDVSLTGITLELPAGFTTSNQSGKVEMITFHDLEVNGLKVRPEEYVNKLSLIHI